MGTYLSTVNQLPDHAQVAASASAITTMNSSISTMAGSISTLNASMSTATSDISGKLGLPNAPQNLTMSLVTSTSAGGIQPSVNKPFELIIDTSAQSTATIAGASTSASILEVCSTNSNTAGDWVEVGRVENDQSFSLAVALQGVALGAGTITITLPAGYWVRERKLGTGTHTETLIKATVVTYG